MFIIFRIIWILYYLKYNLKCWRQLRSSRWRSSLSWDTPQQLLTKRRDTNMYNPVRTQSPQRVTKTRPSLIPTTQRTSMVPRSSWPWSWSTNRREMARRVWTWWSNGLAPRSGVVRIQAKIRTAMCRDCCFQEKSLDPTLQWLLISPRPRFKRRPPWKVLILTRMNLPTLLSTIENSAIGVTRTIGTSRTLKTLLQEQSGQV